MAKQAYKKGLPEGYDVVIIHYRGLDGLKLYTPQLYCSYAVDDVFQPMKYVYDKHCKEEKRQAFAVGTSMGANILGNLLGDHADECFLTAACVLQAPIKKWECKDHIRQSMGGAYDKNLG